VTPARLAYLAWRDGRRPMPELLTFPELSWWLDDQDREEGRHEQLLAAIAGRSGKLDELQGTLQGIISALNRRRR
jgi:hypothetical protein